MGATAGSICAAGAMLLGVFVGLACSSTSSATPDAGDAGVDDGSKASNDCTDEPDYRFNVPRTPCTKSSECRACEFCNFPAGQCSGNGGCVPITQDTSLTGQPVCGCDGHDYINPDYATAAASTIAYGGKCRAASSIACDATHPCADNMVCIVDQSRTCDGGAACGTCVAGDADVCGVNGGVCVAYEACVDTLPSGHACVFTDGVECDTTSCPSGSICVSPVTCAGGVMPCAHQCVVP